MDCRFKLAGCTECSCISLTVFLVASSGWRLGSCLLHVFSVGNCVLLGFLARSESLATRSNLGIPQSNLELFTLLLEAGTSAFICCSGFFAIAVDNRLLFAAAFLSCEPSYWRESMF